MSGQSMSISGGELAGRLHNVEREYRAGLANVWAERTPENQVLVDDSIEDVYAELFGDALEEYNARQKRADRRIADYLEHVRADKRLNEGYELVVQIGNMRTNPAANETCRAVSSLVYREWLGRVQGEFPHLRVYQAAIHVDEATPHMHVAYVPWADGGKGLSRKNTLKGAFAADGYSDVRDVNARMFAILEEVCAGHGIDRVDQACTRAHMSVREFKEMVSEAQGGVYDYRNDPRLVQLVEDMAEQVDACVKLVEECRDFSERTASLTAAPVLMGRSLREVHEEAEKFSKMLASLSAAMSGARTAASRYASYVHNWREQLINPVTRTLARAREKYAERAPQWRARVEAAWREFNEEWRSWVVYGRDLGFAKIRDAETRERAAEKRDELADDIAGARRAADSSRAVSRSQRL